MVITDTVAGVIDGWLCFHYDLRDDVLYLRSAAHPENPSFGEEMADGLILLRSADTDEPLGLTVVNWRKRSGRAIVPDSLEELSREIEGDAKPLAAQAGLQPEAVTAG